MLRYGAWLASPPPRSPPRAAARRYPPQCALLEQAWPRGFCPRSCRAGERKGPSCRPPAQLRAGSGVAAHGALRLGRRRRHTEGGRRDSPAESEPANPAAGGAKDGSPPPTAEPALPRPAHPAAPSPPPRPPPPRTAGHPSPAPARLLRPAGSRVQLVSTPAKTALAAPDGLRLCSGRASRPPQLQPQRRPGLPSRAPPTGHVPASQRRRSAGRERLWPYSGRRLT